MQAFDQRTLANHIARLLAARLYRVLKARSQGQLLSMEALLTNSPNMHQQGYQLLFASGFYSYMEKASPETLHVLRQLASFDPQEFSHYQPQWQAFVDYHKDCINFSGGGRGTFYSSKLKSLDINQSISIGVDAGAQAEPRTLNSVWWASSVQQPYRIELGLRCEQPALEAHFRALRAHQEASHIHFIGLANDIAKARLFFEALLDFIISMPIKPRSITLDLNPSQWAAFLAFYQALPSLSPLAYCFILQGDCLDFIDFSALKKADKMTPVVLQGPALAIPQQQAQCRFNETVLTRYRQGETKDAVEIKGAGKRRAAKDALLALQAVQTEIQLEVGEQQQQAMEQQQVRQQQQEMEAELDDEHIAVTEIHDLLGPHELSLAPYYPLLEQAFTQAFPGQAYDFERCLRDLGFDVNQVFSQGMHFITQAAFRQIIEHLPHFLNGLNHKNLPTGFELQTTAAGLNVLAVNPHIRAKSNAYTPKLGSNAALGDLSALGQTLQRSSPEAIKASPFSLLHASKDVRWSRFFESLTASLQEKFNRIAEEHLAERGSLHRQMGELFFQDHLSQAQQDGIYLSLVHIYLLQGVEYYFHFLEALQTSYQHSPVRFKHFVEQFLSQNKNGCQYTQAKSLNALRELVALTELQWELWLACHPSGHPSINFSEDFHAFKTFIAEFGEFDEAYHLPFEQVRAPFLNARVILERYRLILNAAHNKDEQRHYLLRMKQPDEALVRLIDLGPYGAVYASQYEGYGLVTAGMALSPIERTLCRLPYDLACFKKGTSSPFSVATNDASVHNFRWGSDLMRRIALTKHRLPLADYQAILRQLAGKDRAFNGDNARPLQQALASVPGLARAKEQACAIFADPGVVAERELFNAQTREYTLAHIRYGQADDDSLRISPRLYVNLNTNEEAYNGFCQATYGENRRYFASILANSFAWYCQYGTGHWDLRIERVAEAAQVVLRFEKAGRDRVQSNSQLRAMTEVARCEIPTFLLETIIDDANFLRTIATAFGNKFVSANLSLRQTDFRLLYCSRPYGDSGTVTFVPSTDLNISHPDYSAALIGDIRYDYKQTPRGATLQDGGEHRLGVLQKKESPRSVKQLVLLATQHPRGCRIPAKGIMPVFNGLLEGLKPLSVKAVYYRALTELMIFSSISSLPKIAGWSVESGVWMVEPSQLELPAASHLYLNDFLLWQNINTQNAFVPCNLEELSALLNVFNRVLDSQPEATVSQQQGQLSSLSRIMRYQLYAYGEAYFAALLRFQQTGRQAISPSAFLKLFDKVRIALSPPTSSFIKRDGKYFFADDGSNELDLTQGRSYAYYSYHQWSQESKLAKLTAKLVGGFAILAAHAQDQPEHLTTLANAVARLYAVRGEAALTRLSVTLNTINITASMSAGCQLPSLTTATDWLNVLADNVALDIAGYIEAKLPNAVYGCAAYQVSDGTLVAEIRDMLYEMKDFFRQPRINLAQWLPDLNERTDLLAKVQGSMARFSAQQLNQVLATMDVEPARFEAAFNDNPIFYAQQFFAKLKARSGMASSIALSGLKKTLNGRLKQWVEGWSQRLSAGLNAQASDESGQLLLSEAERRAWQRYVQFSLARSPDSVDALFDEQVLQTFDACQASVSELVSLLTVQSSQSQSEVLAVLACLPETVLEQLSEPAVNERIVQVLRVSLSGVVRAKQWPARLCDGLFHFGGFTQLYTDFLVTLLTQLRNHGLLHASSLGRRILLAVLVSYDPSHLALSQRFFELLLTKHDNDRATCLVLLNQAASCDQLPLAEKQAFLTLVHGANELSLGLSQGAKQKLFQVLMANMSQAPELLARLANQTPAVQSILIMAMSLLPKYHLAIELSTLEQVIINLKSQPQDAMARLSVLYRYDANIPDINQLYALLCVEQLPLNAVVRRAFCRQEDLDEHFHTRHIERLVNTLEQFCDGTWQRLPYPQRKRLLMDFLYVQALGRDHPIMLGEDSVDGGMRGLSVMELTVDQMQALVKSLKEQAAQAVKTGQTALNRRCELQFLALVREAVLRTTPGNVFPNNVQLLSSLLFIDKPVSSIDEIATGEGKTVISTLLMALAWFKGYGTLATTVNAALTARDLAHRQRFCRYLAIPVAEQPLTARSEPTAHTTQSIGQAHFAQAALFRLQQKLNGAALPERECWVADEVDQTALDEETVYRIAENFTGNNDENAYEFLYPLINDFVDFSMIAEADQAEDVRGLILFLQQQVKDLANEKQLLEALLSRGTEPFDIWLDAALRAKALFDETQQGRLHYIVEQGTHYQYGEAIPARFARVIINGRVNRAVSWSDGVHQCLHARLNAQLSEEVGDKFPILPENGVIAAFTAKNTLNDVLSLSKQGGKQGLLLGLTGTIGDPEECAALVQTYGVELYRFNHERPSKRVTLPTLQVADSTLRNEQLLAQVIAHFRPSSLRNRQTTPAGPVLICCEGIDDLNEITNYFLQAEEFQALMSGCHYQRYSAQGYIYDGAGSRVVSDAVRAADPESGILEDEIIARAGEKGMITFSNILGRGANIKPQGEQGLFVLHTNLANERRRRQNEGRAGRQGMNGTTRGINNTVNVDSVVTRAPKLLREAYGDLVDALFLHYIQFNQADDKRLWSIFLVALARRWNESKQDAASVSPELDTHALLQICVEQTKQFALQHWPFSARHPLTKTFYDDYCARCAPGKVSAVLRETQFVPVRLADINPSAVYLQRQPYAISPATSRATEEKSRLWRYTHCLTLLPKKMQSKFAKQALTGNWQDQALQLFKRLLPLAYPKNNYQETLPYRYCLKQLVPLLVASNTSSLATQVRSALLARQAALPRQCTSVAAIRLLQVEIDKLPAAAKGSVRERNDARLVSLSSLSNYRGYSLFTQSEFGYQLLDNLKQQLANRDNPVLDCIALAEYELFQLVLEPGRQVNHQECQAFLMTLGTMRMRFIASYIGEPVTLAAAKKKEQQQLARLLELFLAVNKANTVLVRELKGYLQGGLSLERLLQMLNLMASEAVNQSSLLLLDQLKRRAVVLYTQEQQCRHALDAYDYQPDTWQQLRLVDKLELAGGASVTEVNGQTFAGRHSFFFPQREDYLRLSPWLLDTSKRVLAATVMGALVGAVLMSAVSGGLMVMALAAISAALIYIISNAAVAHMTQAETLPEIGQSAVAL